MKWLLRRRAKEMMPSLGPVEELLRQNVPREVKIYSEKGVLDREATHIAKHGHASKGWIFEVKEYDFGYEEARYLYRFAWMHGGEIKLGSLIEGWGPGGKQPTPWFSNRMKAGRSVTVLWGYQLGIPDEEDPVLFGCLEPHILIPFRSLVDKIETSEGDQRDATTVCAIDSLHYLRERDAKRVVAALRGHTHHYTDRGYDPFYLVGDLYGYHREGNDILFILKAIVPMIGDEQIPLWVAD